MDLMQVCLQTVNAPESEQKHAHATLAAHVENNLVHDCACKPVYTRIYFQASQMVQRLLQF